MAPDQSGDAHGLSFGPYFLSLPWSRFWAHLSRQLHSAVGSHLKHASHVSHDLRNRIHSTLVDAFGFQETLWSMIIGIYFAPVDTFKLSRNSYKVGTGSYRCSQHDVCTSGRAAIASSILCARGHLQECGRPTVKISCGF